MKCWVSCNWGMTPILVVFSFLCCLKLIVVAAAPLHWTGLYSTVVGGVRREKTGCGGLVGALSVFLCLQHTYRAPQITLQTCFNNENEEHLSQYFIVIGWQGRNFIFIVIANIFYQVFVILYFCIGKILYDKNKKWVECDEHFLPLSHQCQCNVAVEFGLEW